ncbi:hypothetical protein PNH38_12485 [Anoxybacillus rupiensis]|uniref:Phr family secreted Rap phosphatase inhibitor n=1 Tax=Anoxybacteroides rupiense TaxID=311460 RepID=A0ABD5ITU9_9BACL|nr:hypothetical protein [Anoxybacillus rupiensis]MDE8564679.1 hypothetical protein [Anoxybacillus rupiensis]MED5051219.1 hypothetical protein [Anoxybacillus rupiensis]
MKRKIFASILALVTVLGVGLTVSNDGQSKGSTVHPNILYPDY